MMFFQFKYHGKIHSPRGLVQCENVRIMGTCAVYIFLPDGTAQIHSVLHNCFRRAWMDLLNFKISFVNVEGFFLQCVMLVHCQFCHSTDHRRSTDTWVKGRYNILSLTSLRANSFWFLKNKFSIDSSISVKKRLFYLWIYNSRESMRW